MVTSLPIRTWNNKALKKERKESRVTSLPIRTWNAEDTGQDIELDIMLLAYL